MTKSEKIKKDILKYIKENMEVGDLFYSEKELIDIYNTSKMTIRKVITLLVNEDVLMTKVGKGTFIKNIEKPSLELTFKNEGLSKVAIEGNVKITSKLRIFEERIDPKIAIKLNLEKSDVLIYWQRVRFLEGEPVEYEETYIPKKLFKDFKEDILNNSFFEYVKKSGYKIGKTERYFKAINSTKKIRESLKLNDNEALFFSEQITYTLEGIPFEYSLSYMHGTKVVHKFIG